MLSVLFLLLLLTIWYLQTFLTDESICAWKLSHQLTFTEQYKSKSAKEIAKFVPIGIQILMRSKRLFVVSKLFLKSKPNGKKHIAMVSWSKLWPETPLMTFRVCVKIRHGLHYWRLNLFCCTLTFFWVPCTTFIVVASCNWENILLSCSAKSLTEHKLVFRAFQSGLKTFVVVYLERTPTI